jgi:hypothetical protein
MAHESSEQAQQKCDRYSFGGYDRYATWSRSSDHSRIEHAGNAAATTNACSMRTGSKTLLKISLVKTRTESGSMHHASSVYVSLSFTSPLKDKAVSCTR